MGTRFDVHKQFSHSKLPNPVYVNLLPFSNDSVNYIHKNKPPAIAGRRHFCYLMYRLSPG